MDYFDPSMLFLSASEEALFLKRFRKTDSAQLTRNEFMAFRSRGLVKGAMSGVSDWFDGLPDKGVCELSDKGKMFRAFLLSRIKETKKNDVSSALAICISILSLGLSVAAFVVSLR